MKIVDKKKELEDKYEQDNKNRINAAVWKNLLPDEFKKDKSNSYDYLQAYLRGAEPSLEEDGFHLPSRDPQTGQILKSPDHPTFEEAIMQDISLGYYPTGFAPNGNVVTEQRNPLKYADGGESEEDTPKEDRLRYMKETLKFAFPPVAIFQKVKGLLSSEKEPVATEELIEPKQSYTDEELARFYVDNVLWTMENPRNKGYNEEDGLYYAYKDKDKKGKIHINIGPGLEKNGHPNIDYNKGYTREEVEEMAYETVLDRVKNMSESLRTMKDGKYSEARDTLSLGPLLTLTDIAYNVKTDGKKNLPEKWPNLTKRIVEGDLEKAKAQTDSGSERRWLMRNDLLTYGPIDEDTVVNRKCGGPVIKIKKH